MNCSFLLCLAAFRTRSNAWVTRPRLCVRCVLCWSAFPLGSMAGLYAPLPTLHRGAELDEAALAVHADSQSRYWKAASGIAEMRHIH